LSGLERFYVRACTKTGFRAWQSPSNRSDYEVLYVVNKHGEQRLALPEDIETRKRPDGQTSYQVTDAAWAKGWVRPAFEIDTFNDAALHTWLTQSVYRSQRAADYAKKPAYAALALWCGLLLVAVPLDRKRALMRLHGRRLRGPEMVTVSEFNRRMRQRARWTAKLLDGVMILDAGQSWFNRTFNDHNSRGACVPLEREAQHTVIVGDTGSGKSAVIRQELVQIAERNEIAIVYDSAGEYVQQFFCPERGDVIINPLDARCPYIDLTAIENEAEALSLAASLFPDRVHENRFFTEAPRKIFAYLITLKPTPQELVQWMSHPEELDQRVRGTELAAMIDPHAPAQRSGVLASLNMVADALKLLPREADTKARWSVSEWAAQRKGWVFITSRPTVRERLRPLISLIIDQLILHCMTAGGMDTPKTWFALDEVASSSLQRLPQLETALMENRKANCPLLLGFQGKAQIEALYGHVSEAMLSQPMTKVFFKTSEANAADWISRTIGEVELERYRESRSHGQSAQGHDSESEQREIVREPLVMASEVSGLEPLHCYIKHGNYVVRLRAAYLKLAVLHAAFVPRKRNPPSDGPDNGGNDASPSTSPRTPSGPQLDLKPSTQQQQEFFE
jgi:hypothetical protein